MKAKDFVTKYFPRMRSEKQKQNNGNRYFLIREIGNNTHFSEGETESKAWKNAMNKVIQNDMLMVNTQQLSLMDSYAIF